MLKLKKSSMKYKDANGNMQDIGAILGGEISGGNDMPEELIQQIKTNKTDIAGIKEELVGLDELTDFYHKSGGNIEGDVTVEGKLYITLDEEFEELGEFVFDKDITLKRTVDALYHIGYVIPTTNPEFDPNTLYPWQTWERFAQGKTLVGVDESDVDFASAMLEGGAKTHTLTVAEIPSHTHAATFELTADKLGGGSTYARINDNGTPTSGIVNIGNTGGDGAHNNLQPYITVYYWRRTA